LQGFVAVTGVASNQLFAALALSARRDFDAFLVRRGAGLNVLNVNVVSAGD